MFTHQKRSFRFLPGGHGKVNTSSAFYTSTLSPNCFIHFWKCYVLSWLVAFMFNSIIHIPTYRTMLTLPVLTGRGFYSLNWLFLWLAGFLGHLLSGKFHGRCLLRHVLAWECLSVAWEFESRLDGINPGAHFPSQRMFWMLPWWSATSNPDVVSSFTYGSTELLHSTFSSSGQYLPLYILWDI